MSTVLQNVGTSEQVPMIQTKPILKWAGGKRWLASKIIDRMPLDNFKRYVEPFAGSAAVFFALCPESAWLNDLNEPLMTTYRAIVKDPERVVKLLAELPTTEADYYRIRATPSKNEFAMAAKFIYLNKAGYNGLYRVNRAGMFNVPYGKRSNIKFDYDGIYYASAVLRNVRLTCEHFADVLFECGEGDVVYCDPPYDGVFVDYLPTGFTQDDQDTLAEQARGAVKRGATVILSNADTHFIRRRYKGSKMKVVTNRRLVAARAESRGWVNELLITVGGQ